MICLFLFFIVLTVLHTNILGIGLNFVERKELVLYQFFFYSLLIKSCFLLNFYALFSALSYWTYFYWMSLKVDLFRYCSDFIIFLLLSVFTFVFLGSVFLGDVSVACYNFAVSSFCQEPPPHVFIYSMDSQFPQF